MAVLNKDLETGRIMYLHFDINNSVPYENPGAIFKSYKEGFLPILLISSPNGTNILMPLNMVHMEIAEDSPAEGLVIRYNPAEVRIKHVIGTDDYYFTDGDGIIIK